jgi:ubiquinone/menaquinone biosynthesis C-methylase UbiE
MSKFKTNLVLILFFTFATSVFAMEEEKTDRYILAVGSKGLQRMQHQLDLTAKDINEHLEKAGSLKGKKILDVGCGFGIATADLATRAGPDGHVVAIDINDEQLEEAKKRIAELNLQNVSFIKHDARSLSDLPEKEFDVIYLRFVLAHVNTPHDVLSGARNVLKEGGLILCQDVVMSTKWWPRDEELFVDYRNLVGDLAAKMGVDYDIGDRLQELHTAAGFTILEGYSRQAQLSTPDAKKLFLYEMEEIGKAIAIGAITPEKVEEWKSTVSDWPDNDPRPFHMARIGYLIAQKRENIQ